MSNRYQIRDQSAIQYLSLQVINWTTFGVASTLRLNYTIRPLAG